MDIQAKREEKCGADRKNKKRLIAFHNQPCR